MHEEHAIKVYYGFRLYFLIAAQRLTSERFVRGFLERNTLMFLIFRKKVLASNGRTSPVLINLRCVATA